MIDAAIVGLGWWGRVHVKSVQGKSDRIRYLTGVTKEPDEVRDLAAEYKFELTTEYADVIEDPAIRAVVLATPHSMHTGQILAAAEAGKHVFCEKPFALKRADAVLAVDACRNAGVALGIGQNRRFWPALREIKRMIDSGELGTIMHVEGNYSHDILADMPEGTWRTDPDETPVAGMTGMGIHLTDAFINFIGPVAELRAQCVDRVLGRQSGDTASVLLRFENGATGYLATTLKTAFLWHIRVLGSEGWVDSYDENEITIRMRGGEPEKRIFDPVDSVFAELEAFADAVDGIAPYPVPPDQIIHNVAILEAVSRSASSGEAIRVE